MLFILSEIVILFATQWCHLYLFTLNEKSAICKSMILCDVIITFFTLVGPEGELFLNFLKNNFFILMFTKFPHEPFPASLVLRKINIYLLINVLYFCLKCVSAPTDYCPLFPWQGGGGGGEKQMHPVPRISPPSDRYIR